VLLALDGSKSSLKTAAYGMARNGDSSHVIALHVIHSQIKYLYSSRVATLVTPQTIDAIVDSAKQEAQEWPSQVKEKANEYNVELKVEFIVDLTSIIGAIVEYGERENTWFINTKSWANPTAWSV
jgi:nucleotide-binding universal stress UspA family protein